MNQNLTEIVFVLDRSGSMQSLSNDVIGGINSFLEDQRKVEGEAVVTMVQFNDRVETLYKRRNLEDVKNLTSVDFKPSGMTALYDAMGIAIDDVGVTLANLPETERPGKVIVVVMTDGEENSSAIYKQSHIKEMVEHQKSVYSWDFVFLAANQDAVTAAANVGIGKDMSLTFAYNSAGIQTSFAATTALVAEIRGGSKTYGYSDLTRAMQSKLGA